MNEFDLSLKNKNLCQKISGQTLSLKPEQIPLEASAKINRLLISIWVIKSEKCSGLIMVI